MAQQTKLTREQLYQKIWEKSTVKLAAEFGISDVGLAKICRKMDVPKPPLGYWRRIEAGAILAPTPLPKAKETTVEFVYLYMLDDSSSRVNQEIQIMIDQENLPENQIKIADNFDDAHPLVKKTKQFYDKAEINSSEPISPPNKKNYLSISVSPAQAHRALLIMDAILKAAGKRGYGVTISSDYWGEETRITKEGEEVRISLYENVRKMKRELTPEEKKKPPYLLDIPTEHQAGGKLTVKINTKWSGYQRWSDRKNESLEERLNDIFAGVVALLEVLVFEKRKKEEEERRHQELIRQREEEKKKREELEADVYQWRKSENVREYLNAYEARLTKEKGKIIPDSREAEWLQWARKYAESVDPLNKIFSDEE